MKTEWRNYLVGIGFERPFLERTEKVLAFYEAIYPGDAEDLFVTDRVSKDGNREYQNLWLFGSKYICEAKSFLSETEDDLDAISIKSPITRWGINKEGFAFPQPSTPSSRIKLRFSMNDNNYGELWGTHTNCDRVMEIFQRYISPHVARP